MTTPRTFSLSEDRQAWASRLRAARRLNGAGASLLGLGALSLWLSGQWRAAVGGGLLAFLWAFLSERAHRQAHALHQAQARAEQWAQAAEQARALQGAQQAHALAQQRMQAGLGNRLAELSAQAAWLAQQRNAVDAQARQLDVQVQLVRALGGGWAEDARRSASR